MSARLANKARNYMAEVTNNNGDGVSVVATDEARPRSCHGEGASRLVMAIPPEDDLPDRFANRRPATYPPRRSKRPA